MFKYSTIKELLEQLEEVNRIRDVIGVAIEGKWIVVTLGPFRNSQNLMTLKLLAP